MIDHPNVVRVHELGWHEGKPYFTMDLVDGGSLEAVRGSVKDPAWYARVMAGVARGLHAAHIRGLAHRDVKPSNILLESDVPRLTDFGLARELSSVGTRLTATGEVLGTPHYMAPEQARSGAFDPALGDQYSVGAVLYDLLAGRPPHDGDSPVAVMMSLTTQLPPPLQRVAPGVPEPLVRVVEQAMSRLPEHRYGSCEALAEDLERYVAGEPVRATAPTLRRRASRALQVARRPLVLGAAAIGVALFTLGTAATWDAVRTQRSEMDRELMAQGALLALEEELDEAIEADDPQGALSALRAHGARHRGTRTAVDTILLQAPRLMELAPDRALALLAEAYTDAPAGPDQDRVLVALAAQLEARWDWTGLAALTTTQARRNPLRVDTVALAAPRARVQLAVGDAERAALTLEAMGDDAGARLARAMGQAAPAPEGLTFHRPLDWDGDGRADLAARHEAGLRVHAVAPGLPVVADVPIGPTDDSDHVHLLPARRLVHWSDGVLRLLDASGPSPEVLVERESSAALTAAATDLDGDGHDEVYVGLGPYERRLLVADLASPEPRFDDAHAATTAAGSDVNQVLPVSVDGREQLWATVGPWRAYDVRRYARPAGPLEVLERHRLGYVSHLQLLDDGRVAALHSEEYGSRVALDPTEPYGPVAGVYVLGPESTDVQDVLPWRGPEARLASIHEADLDGDGRLDWVITARHEGDPALVIHLADDDGFRDPFVVAGFTVVATGQLDDDPADELVVWNSPDAGFWILGTGDPRPVPSPPPMVPSQPAPDGLDPVGDAAWQRAEDLVAMGLYDAAATAFTRLHDQLPRALAPAALARAARLHEASGDRGAAAEAWQRLVGRRQEARSAAVQLLRADHRFDEAAALGGEAAPSADTHWDLVDGDRFADALTVLDPLGAQLGSEGVAVATVAGEPPVAGVRLPWNGRHLALEIDVDVRSLEWGSGLVVGFDDWEDGSVALRSWGGGGLYRLEVECLGPADAHLTRPTPQVEVSGTWTLRVDWYDGELLCQITAPDGETVTATRPATPPPVGDLDLSVRPARHAPESHARARAVLRRWSVTATQDLPTLSARPKPSAPPSVAHDLRLTPGPAVDRLLQEEGAAAVTAFREAHAALHHSHPTSAAAQRAFTVHAAPLLAQDPAALGLDDRRAYAEVLARRGMAWFDLGELASARSDLERADSLLDGPEPSDPDKLLRVDVNLALAASWADQAPETARRYLRQALQLHPVPELAPDRVARYPSLRALGDTWP